VDNKQEWRKVVDNNTEAKIVAPDKDLVEITHMIIEQNNKILQINNVLMQKLLVVPGLFGEKA